jgi:ABC-type phosphate transport system substrate-binding protein
VKAVGVAQAKGAKTIMPTAANVRSGKYVYWRYLYFLRKAGTSWNSEVQAFVNYCLSSAGQKIANIDYLNL